MKKGIILIISILLWFIPVYGQGVYVTVSAEMDSTVCEDQLSEIDSSLLRLKITYENRTNDAVYLVKVGNECRLDGRIGVPRFLRVSLMNPPQTEISNINYSNDTLLVQISRGEYEHWEVLYKPVQIESEYVDHLGLNDDLYLFYDTLRHFPFNRHKELVNDMIAYKTDFLIKYDTFFVFLKPGEKYSDYFDISGLVYFKGHYSFEIRDSHWLNGIIVDNKYDEELKRWYQVIEPYPEKVGIYKYYTGPVISNVFFIDL